MKPLPETFRQDGFDFRILRRRGRVALLAKGKPGHRLQSFEVVLIRERPAEIICGYEYPEREAMPPSESWGEAGWTFTTQANAETAFDRLMNRRGKCRGIPPGFSTRHFSTPGKVETADGHKSRIIAQPGEVGTRPRRNTRKRNERGSQNHPCH